jgi:hypothetical protein
MTNRSFGDGSAGSYARAQAYPEILNLKRNLIGSLVPELEESRTEASGEPKQWTNQGTSS